MYETFKQNEARVIDTFRVAYAGPWIPSPEVQVDFHTGQHGEVMYNEPVYFVTRSTRRCRPTVLSAFARLLSGKT